VDTKRTRADLHQLAELGVTISLDDFGTAYSSLSYLHSFPLQKVKIDQSFLRDLGEDERRVTLLRGKPAGAAHAGLRSAPAALCLLRSSGFDLVDGKAAQGCGMSAGSGSRAGCFGPSRPRSWH
jgi:hypothetical protein